MTCGPDHVFSIASGSVSIAEPLTLSVVIPAFNEERRLPDTLTRLASYLRSHPELLPAEIIVVDDGSTDRTAAIVGELVGETELAVRLETLGVNRGKGAAVRRGLGISRGRWVLISDADLASPIEELEKLQAAGADLAVGSRALKRELIARRQPLARDVLGRCFNVFLRVLGLSSLRDTQCGFKLLRGDLARTLARELTLDGFAFDVELLARATRRGATVVEVPVRWYHVEESRVRPLRHGLAMVRDALRLRWRLWWRG